MLKKGDIIDIVAPSGKCNNEELQNAILFIKSSGLNPRVSDDIFSDDLHCSNCLEYRFQDLKKALYAEDSKVIWCLRGGYGASNLYNNLTKLNKPRLEKLLIGFSDITFLHIFLNQKWNWQSLHAPVLSQYFNSAVSKDSFEKTINILFGAINNSVFEYLKPLNEIRTSHLKGKICGGNLTLIQNSIGTGWQIDATNKFLLLEEVGECAYKVDRLLSHLLQSGIVNNAKAILVGDFTYEDEKDKIEQTIEIFVKKLDIAVFRINNIGHGKRNDPLFLNKELDLKIVNNQWVLG